jgi:hypothetical protein
MNHDELLREHLAWLLREGHAHLTFDQAVANLPRDFRARHVAGIPHSPWQLLEHLRICQWDILEFSRNPDHESPEFPAGYWPSSVEPPEPPAWEDSCEAFRQDLASMIRLVSDPATDLYAPIPHGQGQTILREALLVADHNAYHLGQLVVVRQALGCWPAT